MLARTGWSFGPRWATTATERCALSGCARVRYVHDRHTGGAEARGKHGTEGGPDCIGEPLPPTETPYRGPLEGQAASIHELPRRRVLANPPLKARYRPILVTGL